MIQAEEEDRDSDDSSCTSGESDESDGPVRGKELRLLSGSQTSKFAEMLRQSKGADISQLAYKERDINSLLDASKKDSPGKLTSKLLDAESDSDDDDDERETAYEQELRIRQESPFGHLKSWKLLRVIVKANDDVR